MKGVHAVVTWEDVPRLVYGHLEALGIPGDEPLLAKDEVRYKGQPIALVAAESEEIAQAAVEAVELDLEERPALFDIRKAADPDTPQIHHWGNWYPHFEAEIVRQIRKGDIERHSSRPTRSSGCYRPAAIEQRPMETQIALAVPEAAGRIAIYPYPGDLFLAGRRRGSPPMAAEPAQARRRHRGRRLRWQGRQAVGDQSAPPRAEDPPAGEVALDAGGGVPLLVDPRALAHRDRRRGDEVTAGSSAAKC